MADVHSKETRSYNMSRIKSKNTKPEMLVRQFLHKTGFRYRLHVKDLPGKPDILLPKYKTVIFVHGCFWHGHEGCKYSALPKTRREWWENKIKGNCLKDQDDLKKLINNIQHMKAQALRSLRRKLADQETVVGLWVTLESPSITEMGVALGLDWIVIDAEHGHLDWAEIVAHIRAAVRSIAGRIKETKRVSTRKRKPGPKTL